MWVAIFQRIAIEFFLDFFYFPVWWYTGGAGWMLGHCLEWLASANRQFAPGLWLRNMFVPMFGQYDWQGRVMSFFIRLANVFGRSIALFVWFLLITAAYFAWLVAPAAAVYLFLKAFA